MEQLALYMYVCVGFAVFTCSGRTCATWENIWVLLRHVGGMDTLFSSISKFTERAFACHSVFFAFCSWPSSGKHAAGPAHFGVIWNMFASLVDSGATCVGAVKCTHEMSSDRRVFCVCMVCIISAQGLSI